MENVNSRIMQSKWKEIEYLIFDEVSFIGELVLNNLMTAKNSNKNFKHIISRVILS